MTATGRYVGRHRAGHTNPVPADYNPLAPATRSALAPHHWSQRQLPAGVDERTGLMPRVGADDVAHAGEVATAELGRWWQTSRPTTDQTTDNTPETTR